MTNRARPLKRFGQHWLRDEQILDRIVEAAALKTNDRVLEIGPGTGILTRRLLSVIEALVAVEIDRDLCKKLVKTFGDRDNFLLLQGDILTLDLDSTLLSFPSFQNQHKVVANIPYNITGPILEKLLGTIAQPNKNYQSIILLIQKEVADRLCAKPGTKAFGALSVIVGYLAKCEYVCDVPSRAFYPPPKVDSAVVKLSPQTLVIETKNAKHLHNLVKLGFSQKRKMLKNNLKSAIELDQLIQLLEQLNINAQVRAEDLSIEQWVTLSNMMSAQIP